MPAASPPEGCSTNNNGAPDFKVFGTYSMKVRSRPPTVIVWPVASPIGSAATAVATSANAAPIVQSESLISAMISRLRFTPAGHDTPGNICAILTWISGDLVHSVERKARGSYNGRPARDLLIDPSAHRVRTSIGRRLES